MKNLDALIDDIRLQGRHGDTMLAHINPQEAELLKALGGSGTINPKTGLPEFWGFSVGPVGIGSDYSGVSVGNVSTGGIAKSVVNTAKDTWDTAKNTVKGVTSWAADHPLEAAALVAAGYYYYPEISAWVSPEGSALAGTEAGTATGAATLTAEEVAAEKLAAEQAAAHVTSSVSAEALAAANATSDPLGALIAEQGWSVVDPAYLKEIGLTVGMEPAISSAVSKGVTFSQALDLAKAGLLVNALTGDPLGLSGSPSGNVGGGSTGFDIVPVPEDWKSPTYTTSPVTNVTFEDLFPGVSLQGTQWAGLQNAQPNMTFNDIFSAGLQSTPMGTPVNIADIVGNIVGQSTKS